MSLTQPARPAASYRSLQGGLTLHLLLHLKEEKKIFILHLKSFCKVNCDAPTQSIHKLTCFSNKINRKLKLATELTGHFNWAGWGGVYLPPVVLDALGQFDE